MTESPFVKAEGPEPPDGEDLIREKNRATMAKLSESILDQLEKQSVFSVPETTDTTFVVDSSNEYAYYREQMQPDREEIERVRAEVDHFRMELLRQRSKLAQATDELIRLTQVVQRYESKLFNAYQLIGQLVYYLDSIEWGTHDEWTRSQSLRERAHEYLTVNNAIAT